MGRRVKLLSVPTIMKEGNMTYKFSERSLNNLKGVHKDLVRVAYAALELTEVDFMVTEGLRSSERQKRLMKIGATHTLLSRHITGHAIDVVAIVDGEVSYAWPLYNKIAKAFKLASIDLKIPIKWGGDWHSFPDGPHFELDRKVYAS